MSEQICIMCEHPYEIKDITVEQEIINDGDFCPICWKREIIAFADEDIDFSHLEGLLE